MPAERILVVHNAYQLRGGEDAVVDAEVRLLQAQGHAVDTYFRSNHDITGSSTFSVARDTFWSRRTADEIGARVQDFRPDLIHVHNTFPLISPSIYSVARRLGVPVVQTLHNFRMLCPQAMLLREGRVCEDCVGHVPWRAAVHGCYRGSRGQSAVMATMLATHRGLGTYRDGISRYIALTEFARDVHVRGGLPPERIAVKPNFVEEASSVGMPVGERAGYLFVGRLSAEKGISTLLTAVHGKRFGAIDMVGDGPDRALVDACPELRAHGWQSEETVRRFMHGAIALIMPSIWYEGFPRTLVEAFSCGLPVIASRLGSMASLIRSGETGLLFEPGNAADLGRAIEWAGAHPKEMLEMGRRCHAEYLARYTPDRNYEQLMAIYRGVLMEPGPVPKRRRAATESAADPRPPRS